MKSMIDFAYPSSRLPVQHEGSNRVCASLSQSTLGATPGCRLTDTTEPKLHQSRDGGTRLAMRTKISAGLHRISRSNQ
jgi:hypothetical protein